MKGPTGGGRTYGLDLAAARQSVMACVAATGFDGGSEWGGLRARGLTAIGVVNRPEQLSSGPWWHPFVARSGGRRGGLGLGEESC
jgi:hypothetical protein